jgi:hypothetical protein
MANPDDSDKKPKDQKDPKDVSAVSGNLVTPAPAPDAAQQGAAGMNQHVQNQDYLQSAKQSFAKMGGVGSGATLASDIGNFATGVGQAAVGAPAQATGNFAAETGQTVIGAPARSFANTEVGKYLGAPAPTATTVGATAPSTEAPAATSKLYAPDLTARLLRDIQFRQGYGQAHSWKGEKQSPEALANDYAAGMANVQRLQDVFRQHDENRLAQQQGRLVTGPDGKQYTTTGTSQAGDLVDENGKVFPLQVTSRTQGVDEQGRKTEYIETPYGKMSVTRGNAPKPALASGVVLDRDENGRPTKIVPTNDYVEQQANNALKQGIVMPGSPASKYEDAINQRIKANQPFADLLAERDKAASQPGFNRSPVAIDRSGAALPTNLPQLGNEQGQENVQNPGPMRFTNAAPTEAAQKTAVQRALSTAAALPTREEMEKGGQIGNIQLPGINSYAQQTAAQDQANAVRETQIAARNRMEEAMQPAPNGDPLRDAKIAADRAEAAKEMARANGVDVEKNPQAAAQYLQNNGTKSSGELNRLALQHLQGASLEDLVRQSVYNNAGGTAKDRRQNEEALKQAAASEGVRSKEENLRRREERLAQSESAEAKNAFAMYKDREDRATALESDVAKSAQNPELIAKLHREAAAELARYRKLMGIEEEKVDQNGANGQATQTAPQPKAPPKKGDVVNGFRFKGGSPNDKNNYEKV